MKYKLKLNRMNFSNQNQKIKKMKENLMAKILKKFLLIALILLSPVFAQSQDSKSNQAYWIHEDRVKPSMVEEYEQVAKDLVAACSENNIQDNSWLTVKQDDNTYLYITPIESLADLDVNGFATLEEKMGKDKLAALFNRFNPCYNEHGDYVVYLNKILSYMPDGITQTVEGKSYRTFYYNYVTPSNNEYFFTALKKIKNVFTKNKSKLDYRVYKTGFGVMGTYYMVVISGVDAEKMAKAGNENRELIKDDFEPLLAEMSKYTWKNDEKTGWMREDLSYTPKK
jgi:hypothetical protein